MRLKATIVVVALLALAGVATAATAIVPPIYVDYTLCGGTNKATGIGVTSGIYDVKGSYTGAVVFDTVRTPQGQLRDTITFANGRMYNPMIWSLALAQSVSVVIGRASGSGVFIYPAVDSIGIKIPGEVTQIIFERATADTGAANTFAVVGFAGPRIEGFRFK